MTREQIFEQFPELDFKIERCANFTELNGKKIPTGSYSLINSKTELILNDSVGEKYGVSQNSEVIDLILSGIEPFSTELSVRKAGVINGGGKIYLQLEVNGENKFNNDVIQRYVTALDSNDGTTALSIGIGDITMSCANQFWKFHKRSQSRFKHTASISARMQEIPRLIENALAESMRQMELYQKMYEHDVKDADKHKLVHKILGHAKTITLESVLAELHTKSKNIMEKVYENIETEMKSKGSNLWGLHSGITRYTTHDMNLKGDKSENARFSSVLVGSGYAMNQKSLEFAGELIGMEV